MRTALFNIAQVIIASGILYGYYHFFLRNKLFHQYNRFYLLSIVVISLVIPFLQIPVYFEESTPGYVTALSNWQSITMLPSTGIVTPTPAAASSTPLLTSTQLVYAIYFLIAIALLIRILASLLKIRAIIHRYTVQNIQDIHFINTEEPGAPFSFFRWLFWHRQIDIKSAKGEQIFRHEIFHIRQHHSIDRIFLEIVNAVCWINPFFYLIAKELKAIHEFLADQFATRNTDKWEYSELLLMQALDTQQRLANPFFNNQIKRRIAMITKPQKTSHQYLRKLLVLPLAAVLVSVFAFRYHPTPITEPALSRSGSELKIPFADTSKKFLRSIWGINVSVQEIFVETPGYNDANRYIAPGLIVMNNQPYSSVEFQNRIKDAITVEAKTMIAIPPDNKEAIRKYGDKAKDGVIELGDAILVKPYSLEKYPDALSGVVRDAASEPLIIVNGKIMQKGSDEFQKIDPQNISSITVLKNEKATEKYGAAAKNGVIEVTLKDPNHPGLDSPRPDMVPERNIRVRGVVTPDTNSRVLPEVVLVAYADKDPKEVVVMGYSTKSKPAEPATDIQAWRKYLERNVNSESALAEGWKPGNYTVMIEFTRKADGTVTDVKPLSFRDSKTAAHCVKVIRDAGNEVKAPVLKIKQNSYVQPLTFVILEKDKNEIVVEGTKQ